ncbi:MAG TPA: hypothetical protein PLU22_26825 [Polyangiaceae bacterium]|nr:hypothetical protein [Polyangiaceae bacterium]
MTPARLLLVAVAAAGVAGCGPRLSDRECRDLLDRYTLLLLRAEAPRLPADEIDRLRVQAQVRLAARPELARCAGRVSRRAYDCAMRAASSDEIERCLL